MSSSLSSDEELIEAQLSDFQKCVVQIRRVSSNRLGKLEGSIKKILVDELFCNYCLIENKNDIFEGFLRLLVFFGKNVKPSEGYVPSTVIAAFHKFIINNLNSVESRNFVLKNTFLHDTDIYVIFIIFCFKLFFFYYFFREMLYQLR